MKDVSVPFVVICDPLTDPPEEMVQLRRPKMLSVTL